MLMTIDAADSWISNIPSMASVDDSNHPVIIEAINYVVCMALAIFSGAIY